MTSRILLVEPNFPFPSKSKNKADTVHKNFVPVGLLKLGSQYKGKGDEVKLVRGNKNEKEIGFTPNIILVTSIFTYWSNYVWNCIRYYRKLFPDSEIHVGGIYVTLHSDTEKFKRLSKEFDVKVSVGINQEAEKYLPDYSLLPEVDYHATHMMRGCIRTCKFCGVWRLEPKSKRSNKTKDEIITELKAIGKNRVIFYDNNILANPHIKEILRSFSELKINGKPVWFESQSGFDGRLLEKDPELAELIKKAGFHNVRIAWDNSVEDKDSIKKQINFLVKAGYPAKDISVFMIYNFDTSFEDMLKKLDYCNKWGVQITDCRYRPIDWDHDNYKSYMRNGQPEGSFYIHKKAGWTDEKIRAFRKEVRKHNIEIRYARYKGLKYDSKMEKWSAIHNTFKFFNIKKTPSMEEIKKSRELQERIKLLTKIKNQCKKRGIQAPDFSKLNMGELDEKLWLLDKKIKSSNFEEVLGILTCQIPS